MGSRRIASFVRVFALVWAAASLAAAAEHHGHVVFTGIPVPGATVTAARDDRKLETVTGADGRYSFEDLSDGTWTIAVEMSGFAPVKRDVAIAPGAPAPTWELKLLPLDRIRAAIQRPAPPLPEESVAPAAGAAVDNELSQRAEDGLLINGSVNNGAASPFSQAAAFGNQRFGGKSLYNGSLGMIVDNSSLDARPYSLTGQNTPKAAYNRMTGVATLGGPLRIPRVTRNGGTFFIGYQWTRNRNATTESALVPDLAARSGILPGTVVDPLTGAPFPGNAIPSARISPQARALLDLYPLPNIQPNSRYNFQVPIVTASHQDSLQSRYSRTLGPNNQVYGALALESTRRDNPNLFGFLDKTGALGINASANWSHRLTPQVFLNLGYQFSRQATRVTPYFENRANVSGNAGISGNNQDPVNWGPPSLVFSSGLAGLTDARSSSVRNQTSGLSYSTLWNRRAHNLTFGADFRRQQFNSLGQQNPRGTFTFTGASAGSDFAGFLLGIPDASAIAFGNADQYFRESVYDAYFTDDWRIASNLTLNAGMRWEYGAPITELYDRLVNLDIAPGFAAVAPVVAASPTGALTGARYPRSLVRSDTRGFQPRVGLAWRPVAGSSLIVRAGYGIYRDTSVYQTLSAQMAQQPPLAKTLSVQNDPATPLTLANGFPAPGARAANTFAIDPDYRVGYAQNWQLSVQRDLPAALQMTATYLGTKGTRGLQAFLPNTYPVGAANPCPACPAGFTYLASNANSARQAAQVQVRRRLRSGLGAILQYTFAKAIDDAAALGGQGAGARNANAQNAPPAAAAPTGAGHLAIAQNWLDLRADRGPSTFDQRHLASLQLQYTTGMGITGGTLLNGWKGAAFKDWTFATQVTAGSGPPQTPVYLVPVPGTGVTGTVRPDSTGAAVYASSGFLNPAAYTPPSAGHWGNAGRGSITGPARFTLNASIGRTFRLHDRFSLDLRVDAANALNHVTYTAWTTTINSAQFGLPVAANDMRSLQTTLRLRF